MTPLPSSRLVAVLAAAVVALVAAVGVLIATIGASPGTREASQAQAVPSSEATSTTSTSVVEAPRAPNPEAQSREGADHGLAEWTATLIDDHPTSELHLSSTGDLLALRVDGTVVSISTTGVIERRMSQDVVFRDIVVSADGTRLAAAGRADDHDVIELLDLGAVDADPDRYDLPFAPPLAVAFDDRNDPVVLDHDNRILGWTAESPYELAPPPEATFDEDQEIQAMGAALMTVYTPYDSGAGTLDLIDTNAFAVTNCGIVGDERPVGADHEYLYLSDGSRYALDGCNRVGPEPSILGATYVAVGSDDRSYALIDSGTKLLDVGSEESIELPQPMAAILVTDTGLVGYGPQGVTLVTAPGA